MPIQFKYRFRWSTFIGVMIFGTLVPTFFIPLNLWGTEHLISIIVGSLTGLAIWEGAKAIQKTCLFYFPWEKSIPKHLFWEITLVALSTSTLLIIGILLYDMIVPSIKITLSTILQNVFVAFSLAFLFTAINEGNFLFDRWKGSLLEQERLKKENTEAKLEGLKKQLDPHFLFNSLSVLSGLIYSDVDLADKFITKLSQVYRYIIEHNKEGLVSLKEEIDFIEAYFFLMKIRFQNQIKLTISQDLIKSESLIPPLALQLLVENAIKHNQLSTREPLDIIINLKESSLTVENRIKKRSQLEGSTKTGLENLKSRYLFYSDQELIISSTENIFSVELPLIFK